ncbi:MAG: M15 family metallopeptidase domain-containing protein [Minisyncoccota bacterium]
MTVPSDLVYIDEYGLIGSNFYWHKYATHGLTKEDILQTGLTSDRVQVSRRIIDALVSIDGEFKKDGRRLYVKEGYRSEALYNIVYKRRVAKYGKEITDTILNINDMPHASGLTVDVALWNEKEDKEIFLRSPKDGVPAFFVHFYQGKDDPESRKYQELQEYVIRIMMRYGFRLGSKREYFHFDYRPEIQSNYV